MQATAVSVHLTPSPERCRLGPCLRTEHQLMQEKIQYTICMITIRRIVRATVLVLVRCRSQAHSPQPIHATVYPSAHPTPPTIASTNRFPKTTLPPIYPHFHPHPCTALASTANVDTVLRHPQNPCWIAYSALQVTAGPPLVGGLLCAAKTPEMTRVAIILARKVPMGNRSMKGSRGLRFARRNRNIAPGGARRRGNTAGWRKEGLERK